MSEAALASALRSRLEQALGAARERAAAAGRPVLAAVREKVTQLEPLTAFESARTGDRFFWRYPGGGASFAGLGRAAAWTEEELPRIEAAWHRLLGEAILDGDDGSGKPLEPKIVGGLRFERERPYDPLWRDFPPIYFFLPELLLESDGERAAVTASAVVDAEAEAEGLAERVSAGLRELVARQAGRESDWHEPSASGCCLAGPRATRGRRDEGPAGPGALAFQHRPDREGWRRAILEALGAIAAEELDKVVLARQLRLISSQPFNVGGALRRLAAGYPDCHLFALGRGDSVFLGATPERLVRLDGRRVESASLAGSAARGVSGEEDRARAAGLLASAKERWEHTLVVQALRQVLEAVGTGIEAPAEPSLLTLANLHHLHTPLAATLEPGRSFLEVAAALHPSPAVGGFPRQRARDFLRRHEAIDRGWYAAPVGWLDGEGSAELVVALRSGLLRGREATLFAGCGIVAGSEPEAEWRESELKLEPMLEALAGRR